MTISFTRLQEYLDLIVKQQGGHINNAPHHRFWDSHLSLMTKPVQRPKCQGQDIFPVKYLDEAKTQVDADNSPLFLILTDSQGFCAKEQMPPGGPFITAGDYSLTLSDGTVVTGDQVKKDIHDWLAANGPDDAASQPAVG
jgi:hypothetical protein